MNRVLALLVLLSSVAACGGKPKARPPETVPVTVATAESRDVPEEVRVVGNVKAASTVEVKARVGGQVTRVFFKEGDEVKAGAPLFEIDSRPLEAAVREAEAVLLRDRVRGKNAEQEAARYGTLVQKEFVTREQYDQSIANAEAAKATVKADEASVENARLSLGYARVLSPITGRTGSVLVHAGNVVKPNDDKALVVIHQIRPVDVTFAVPERHLPRIREELARGRLSVAAVPAETAQAPREGQLSFIDNAVDSTTGTVVLKATFPNEDGALWPGQFVNVSLRLSTEKGATVVPSQAVQTGQSGTYVFVVKDDLTVESRKVAVARTYVARVATGEASGEEQLAVVSNGLKAGERVVTDGQLRLSSGSKVEIKS